MDIRVPMEFKTRGGRREIILPPDAETQPKAQQNRPLVLALVRAHRWQRMIDSGEVPGVEAIAARYDVDRAYVSRILGLAMLAPDLAARVFFRASHCQATIGPILSLNALRLIGLRTEAPSRVGEQHRTLMIATAHSYWRPHELLRIEDVLPTNMRVVRAVTDAGKAYIKPMGGSDHGPHCLACELIGTRLAGWFGLQTLDHAVIRLTELDAEMIQDTGGRAEAGPAFATRAISEATPWGGSAEELEKASNPQSVPRFVIFDTWTLNWDRCPPDGDGRRKNYENVLLARQEREKQGHLCVLAIDHGECFADKQELTHGLASIARIQDDRVFGLFPSTP